ncbi:Ca2+-dependent phosphoinositide-specific phospholipase C [Pseudoalteromonas sp. ASV78]|uniref:Ca2+-dependent phosphoinositide-specific phospholipase C n=1 Tax=Pseudoalteromonas sp. ASV78 TaxID=3397851 RepID=UPI0039FBA71E
MFSKGLQVISVMVFLSAVSLPVKAAVKLNELQVIGSHNSYKTGLDEQIVNKLDNLESGFADKISYAHPALNEQLDLGLRQLEIDVLADNQGGRYSNPLGQAWTKNQLYSDVQKQQLAKPGFKVLHIPDIDVGSHCVLFAECLTQLKSWSNQHPHHLPIYILFNVKESRWTKMAGVQPELFSVSHYQALSKEIAKVLGQDKLLTPADVKQPNQGLAESIKSQGWPELESVRGKFVFIFDVNERQLQRFAQVANPNMFAAWPISHPNAAFLLFNNPQQQHKLITQAVAQGFIVRTRADEFNAKQSPHNRAKSAITSGAQIISSDFYLGAKQTPLNAPFVSFKLVKKQHVKQPANPFVRCVSSVTDCPL